MKQAFLSLLRVLFLFACTFNVWGQNTANDFPNRPMRFVVGFPAGSSTDIVSRMLAQRMSERFGQPFIVEQKVGGGGSIANDFVAKSAPDGLNMVLLTGGHPSSAAMIKKLPYDPVKDFGMISTIVTYPMVISVAKESAIKSLTEISEFFKTLPSCFSW